MTAVKCVESRPVARTRIKKNIEVRTMEDKEIIEAIFGSREDMPSIGEQISRQLLPTHSWLMLGWREAASNSEDFYASLTEYAQRRETRFKGLEHTLLNHIQPRHDVEKVSLASLFD